MKRLFRVLTALCLLCALLPTAARAATRSWYLEEGGVTIALPDDYVVFTRDVRADDPNLSKYGLTRDGMLSLMKERNIYLNAWDRYLTYELVVTVIDSPFEDYNLFSETALNALVSAAKSEYADGMGVTVLDNDIYQGRQAKFARLYISQREPGSGQTVYGLQYNTVYGGKALNITMQSFSGRIDAQKEAVLKKIVDEVRFDHEPQLPEAPDRTPSFVYTDPKSGTQFTVPADWVETPMSEEREYIDAKFTSNLEPGMSIIYCYEDLLTQEIMDEAGMTAEEQRQALALRWTMDNDAVTKEEIPGLLGLPEADVTRITCGGQDYYRLEATQTASAYGLEMDVDMVNYVRLENGYVYWFQFGGTRDNPYFGDFEAMVASARYPGESELTAEQSGSEEQSRIDEQIAEAEPKQSGTLFVLLPVAAVGIIVLAIIFCVRRRKEEQEENRWNDDRRM